MVLNRIKYKSGKGKGKKINFVLKKTSRRWHYEMRREQKGNNIKIVRREWLGNPLRRKSFTKKLKDEVW